MSADMGHKLVGFDRKIHLSWLDATADWASQGLPAADIRNRLDRLLAGQVAGIGSHSARGKTMTVLMHVWVLVPDTLLPLRDDGLVLLRDRGEDMPSAAPLGHVPGRIPVLPRRRVDHRTAPVLAGQRCSVPGRPPYDRVLGYAEHGHAGRTTNRPFVRRLGCRGGDGGAGDHRAGAKDRGPQRGSRRLAPRSRNHGRRQPSVPTPRACGFIFVLSVRPETRGTRPRASAAARSPPPSARRSCRLLETDKLTMLSEPASARQDEPVVNPGLEARGAVIGEVGADGCRREPSRQGE